MSNHPIVHVDFPANDPEASAKYYAELFGWQTKFDSTYNYWMFQAEGGPGGGFPGTSEVDMYKYKPGEVIVYVGTNDVDATLAKAESLGGKTVVPKVEMGEAGAFAIFADPEGNYVGLYTDPQQSS